PHLDLQEEKAVQEAMLALIRAGLVRSAHDVSDGGLAVCLAESVIFSDGLGLRVDIAAPGLRRDAVLFGEAQSRIVFTVAPDCLADVEALLEGRPVQATRLGEVTATGRLSLTLDGTTILDLDRAQMADPYENALPARMQALIRET
ncbi:MAG: phosphoribosylformylglycinamidine synthase subunit PurL, partial [Bacteroidetes bacterium]